MDDQTLAKRCADGDNEAWAFFLEQYDAFVRFIIRRTLSSVTGRAPDHEIEDLHDELIAWLLDREGKILKSYRGESKLTSWLGVILGRRIKRILHQKGRKEGGTVSIDALTISGATSLQDERPGLFGGFPPEAVDALRDALAGLKDRDRRLLVGAFLEKRRYSDLAEELGVQEASVGQLLYRAKLKLKKKLGGDKFVENLSGSILLLLSLFGRIA